MGIAFQLKHSFVFWTIIHPLEINLQGSRVASKKMSFVAKTRSGKPMCIGILCDLRICKNVYAYANAFVFTNRKPYQGIEFSDKINGTRAVILSKHFPSILKSFEIRSCCRAKWSHLMCQPIIIIIISRTIISINILIFKSRETSIHWICSSLWTAKTRVFRTLSEVIIKFNWRWSGSPFGRNRMGVGFSSIFDCVPS